MKKLLLIDFNKTLQDRLMWQSIKDPENPLYGNFDKIDNFVFKERRDLLEAWLIGSINTEDVHLILAEELKLDYQILLDTFIYDCEQMIVGDEFLSVLQELQEKYWLILSTDNMDSFDRFILPQNPYLKVLFDEIHNSYNLKIRKSTNKGEYFKRVLYKYNILSKDMILVDDSSKSCLPAKNIGIKVFQPKSLEDTLDILHKL